VPIGFRSHCLRHVFWRALLCASPTPGSAVPSRSVASSRVSCSRSLLRRARDWPGKERIFRSCPGAALISSPESRVIDVADDGLGLRRERVIWSASPTQLALIPLPLQAFWLPALRLGCASKTCPRRRGARHTLGLARA
jgi:hypothetical protein